jgi:hypothetical protein
MANFSSFVDNESMKRHISKSLLWMLLPALAFGLFAFIVPRRQAKSRPALFIQSLDVIASSANSGRARNAHCVQVEPVILYRQSSFWDRQMNVKHQIVCTDLYIVDGTGKKYFGFIWLPCSVSGDIRWASSGGMWADVCFIDLDEFSASVGKLTLKSTLRASDGETLTLSVVLRK